ncbi:hypothetical protein Tco_1262825 [Tanacetum coccineum]
MKLTTGSQRSEDVRSWSSHPVDNDDVLDRLKFINKGEEHQVYGTPILVTSDIENSKAYKTFISISTGAIPPKKGRGKGAQGTKKESSDEESDEQEERLIRRKPRGLVIQDTPHVSKKKSIDQSQKLKELVTTPKVPDEPTGKSTILDEGAGTSPEVSNEKKNQSECSR